VPRAATIGGYGQPLGCEFSIFWISVIADRRRTLYGPRLKIILILNP
jgi:hypothetical protein